MPLCKLRIPWTAHRRSRTESTRRQRALHDVAWSEDDAGGARYWVWNGMDLEWTMDGRIKWNGMEWKEEWNGSKGSARKRSACRGGCSPVPRTQPRSECSRGNGPHVSPISTLDDNPAGARYQTTHHLSLPARIPRMSSRWRDEMSRPGPGSVRSRRQ